MFEPRITAQQRPLVKVQELYLTVLDTVKAQNIYDVADHKDFGEKGDAYQCTQHLKWMLMQMRTMQDQAKFDRWLGFVQGVMWMQQMYSLDNLKQHVRDAQGKE